MTQTDGKIYHILRLEESILSKWVYYPRQSTDSICAKSLQSCMSLCTPRDWSFPGSSVHGILLARILERVAMSSSRGSSWPRDWDPCLLCPALAGWFSTTSATWQAAAAKLLQSCLTLCDPMDCSLPGSSIHGIFQARELEWVATVFTWEAIPIKLPMAFVIELEQTIKKFVQRQIIKAILRKRNKAAGIGLPDIRL